MEIDIARIGEKPDWLIWGVSDIDLYAGVEYGQKAPTKVLVLYFHWYGVESNLCLAAAWWLYAANCNVTLYPVIFG